MNRNLTLIIVLALILGVGGILVYQNKDEVATAPAEHSDENMSGEEDQHGPDVLVGFESPTGLQATTSVDVTVGANQKVFTVNGSNYAFSPSVMNVKKGDNVKIIFKNTGGFHDLRIDEFNVATKKINGGAEDVVEFVADKVGTFEYYCSIGSHRAMGMKGSLIVQ